MELKIKDRENITIFIIDTKLNRNTEHTITEFYKELKEGEHEYQLDMQGTNLTDMYKILLVDEGETLEEIFVSDMTEIIEHEIMDEKQKQYGEKVLKELMEEVE